MSQNMFWPPSGGGSANQSVGGNYATAPSYATEVGFINGAGELTPVSYTSPLPISSFPSDQYLNSQSISARDVSSTSNTYDNGQIWWTGTPTASSAAMFGLSESTMILVKISGTWTGTLQFEMSNDGVTWIPTAVHQQGSDDYVFTITNNFIGQVNGAAKTNFRVRATAAMTGTAVVSATTTENLAEVYVGNAVKLAVDSSLPAGTNALGSVSVSNFPATQPVSAVSLPLPAGAATAANQATEISSLATIATNTTGAATAANQATEISSLSTIAANTGVAPPNLSIIGASGAGTVGNNLLLATAGTAAVDTTGYSSGSVQITSAAAVGTFVFEGSNDNTNFVTMQVYNQALTNGTPINATIAATASTIIYRFPVAARYVRVRVVSSITGNIQATTTLGVSNFTLAVPGVVATQGPANVTANGWPVKLTDGTNIAVITPASTAAAAASPAVTVALSPNSPLPAGSNALGSVSITGNPAANIAQYGGVATSLGAKASASSIPVVLASDQASIPVVQGASAGVANAPVMNNYATTNVTTTAYVQLIASTTAAATYIDIFDSSGQAMILATGAAGSEVILYYVQPGGQQIRVAIPASTRVAIKALTANATSGYITLNLLK